VDACWLFIFTGKNLNSSPNRRKKNLSIEVKWHWPARDGGEIK
jgi:hypothetical protein